VASEADPPLLRPTVFPSVFYFQANAQCGSRSSIQATSSNQMLLDLITPGPKKAETSHENETNMYVMTGSHLKRDWPLIILQINSFKCYWAQDHNRHGESSEEFHSFTSLQKARMTVKVLSSC